MRPASYPIKGGPPLPPFPPPRRDNGVNADGCLNFGKHAGQHVSDLPEGYLRWLLQQPWITPALRSVVEQRLDTDVDDTHEQPDDTPARILFPRVVFLWQETMRQQYALSTAVELAVVEQGLVELRKLCSELTHKAFPSDAEFEAARKDGGL